MAKALTRDQVEGRKEKAARFTETVLRDPDRADEIRDESVEDYAERRKFQIINPRRPSMAHKSPEELREEISNLKEQIRDLEEQNQDLEDRLAEIADISSPDEEEEEEDEEEDEEEEEE